MVGVTIAVTIAVPLSLGQCEAGEHYAEQLKDTIRCTVPKGRLAAFFAEPIQVSSASVCCTGCRIELTTSGEIECRNVNFIQNVVTWGLCMKLVQIN